MPSPARGLSDPVAQARNARSFSEEDRRITFALHRGTNARLGPDATTHERDTDLPHVVKMFDVDPDILRGLDIGDSVAPLSIPGDHTSVQYRAERIS